MAVSKFIFVIFFSVQAFAFSPEECDTRGYKSHLQGMPRGGLLDITSGIHRLSEGPSSTTSWAVSTGDCAALRKDTRALRLQFMVDNIEVLKTQCSRGEGEHLMTLASLYGCKGASVR